MKRHFLAAASEGFAAPPLLIEPIGEQFILQWKHSDLSDYGVSFISAGAEYVDREEICSSLTRFVNAVISRLEDEGVKGSFLQEEWKAILATPREEAEFSAMAGRLGCDPCSLDPAQQNAILRASGMLSRGVADEFFASAELQTLEDQASALNALISKAQAMELQMRPLKVLRERGIQFESGKAPWEQGYLAAREVRKALNMDGQIVGSVARIGELIGVNPKEWEAASQGTISGITNVDAVVATTRGGAPYFTVRHSMPTVRSFAICRALFEYLAWPKEAAGLVVNTHSERQKRNRAFAAEFLAPAEKLRETIHGRTVSDDDIQEIADSFDVAPHVIRHQIQNHRLASVGTWPEQ